MDAHTKLLEIAPQMNLEPAEETGISVPHTAPCGVSLKPDKKEALGVFQASMSGGKTMPMLKTLLTSACERDCAYCPFRAGRNYRRTTFKPEEMATTFMQMYRAGMVQGLFLSSGIIGGGVKTQDKLLAVGELLRHKHAFRGYLHLKLMPGVEKAQVERAMQLADRLSVNLEAPNGRRLSLLAPKKQFAEELLRPLQWVEEIRQSQSARQGWNGRWPSTVTQFVVGAVEESDLELLQTSQYLIQQLHLTRTYYSAFSPIRDTPLENRPAENPLRKHRLYQASFLFRDYGWELEDLPFTQAGNLPLDIDPKLAWAKENLLHTPLEINHASPRELLQVPGIGEKGAEAIVKERRNGRFHELNDLKAIGVQIKRVAPFVLIDGKRPSHQPSLFDNQNLT